MFDMTLISLIQTRARPLIITLAYDETCARVAVQLESMEIKASPEACDFKRCSV